MLQRIQKKFTNKCNYYDVPLYFFGTKKDLGKAIERKELRINYRLNRLWSGDGIIKQLDTDITDMQDIMTEKVEVVKMAKIKVYEIAKKLIKEVRK